MDKVKESQEKALEFLKTIQSVDDLKAHKDEMVEFMVDILKSAIAALKEFFELALSAEEKQKELEKYQDEHFIFSEEIEAEVDRIDNLPGIQEQFENFQEDMEKQLQPYLDEMAEQMASIMQNFMGDLMGGLTDGLGEAFGGAEDEEEPPSVDYHWDEFEEVKFFLEYRNIESLKKGKDDAIEDTEWRLDGFLDTLNNLKFISEEMSIMKDDLDESVKRQELIDKELTKGFKNLADLPGGEEVEPIKEEIMNRLKPKLDEINKIIEELKKAKIE